MRIYCGRMSFNARTLIANDPHPAVVQHRHMSGSAGAEHVKRVLWLARRVGCREYSATTELELEQSRGGIFYFAIKHDVGRRCFHFNDRTEYVHQHFNPMTAEVKHRPTTRMLSFEQPATWMIRWRIECFEVIDLHQNGQTDFTR